MLCTYSTAFPAQEQLKSRRTTPTAFSEILNSPKPFSSIESIPSFTYTFTEQMLIKCAWASFCAELWGSKAGCTRWHLQFAEQGLALGWRAGMPTESLTSEQKSGQFSKGDPTQLLRGSLACGGHWAETCRLPQRLHSVCCKLIWGLCSSQRGRSKNL